MSSVRRCERCHAQINRLLHLCKNKHANGRGTSLVGICLGQFHPMEQGPDQNRAIAGLEGDQFANREVQLALCRARTPAKVLTLTPKHGHPFPPFSLLNLLLTSVLLTFANISHHCLPTHTMAPRPNAPWQSFFNPPPPPPHGGEDCS